MSGGLFLLFFSLRELPRIQSHTNIFSPTRIPNRKESSRSNNVVVEQLFTVKLFTIKLCRKVSL